MSKKIIHVVGARPNFMKMAPVYLALNSLGTNQLIVHTGQHYDEKMSDVFFGQLELPKPDINLEVGSGGHSEMTAKVMTRFDEFIEKENASTVVVVYGDVNSTVACALVAKKRGIFLCHVEAGLRSFDRAMPEEINRIVVDSISDLHFTTSVDADRNLSREGIADKKIHFVGNCMIDTLIRLSEKATKPEGLEIPDRFVLATIHRPSNVDDRETLRAIVEKLDELSAEVPVIIPMHPRTAARIKENRIEIKNMKIIEPLGYLEFLWLQRFAELVVTDSGGIQEEATYLGIPCLTMRENTERPITVEMGTNELVGNDLELLRHRFRELTQIQEKESGDIPPLWDGKAGKRIACILKDYCE